MRDERSTGGSRSSRSPPKRRCTGASAAQVPGGLARLAEAAFDRQRSSHALLRSTHPRLERAGSRSVIQEIGSPQFIAELQNQTSRSRDITKLKTDVKRMHQAGRLVQKTFPIELKFQAFLGFFPKARLWVVSRTHRALLISTAMPFGCRSARARASRKEESPGSGASCRISH